jgi:hypothetical protein
MDNSDLDSLRELAQDITFALEKYVQSCNLVIEKIELVSDAEGRIAVLPLVSGRRFTMEEK